MAKFTGKEQPQNPVVVRYTWNGGDEGGSFSFYNKEKKEKIDAGLLSSFVILRQGRSVAGWNDAAKTSVWSNEVEYTTEIMKVKCGDAIVTEGIRKDIKPTVVAQGGHIQLVLTILMEGKIQGIQLKGSQVAVVLDYLRNHSFQKYSFKFTGYTEEQKGKIRYRVPTISIAGEIENIDECLENSEIVDQYFASRTKAIIIDNSVSDPDTFVDDLLNELKDTPASDADLPFN